MIALENAVFRDKKVTTAALSFVLPAGVTAVVGSEADGRETVLQGVGERRARSGRVRFGTRDLSEADIAFVGLEAPLPTGLFARECIDLGTRARKIVREEGSLLLERFGLGALAGRRVESLTREERRAVALADALTSQRRVLILADPLSHVAAEASPAVLRALRQLRDRGGDTVVLTSAASPELAADFATTLVLLDRGRAMAPTPASRLLAASGHGPVQMRIVAREPMNLLRELAREGLTTEATGGAITVTGTSLATVAKAIQRAIVRAGDPIAALVQESIPVAHSRASLAGDERAAYDAAYMARTQALAAARVPAASSATPLVAEAVPGPESVPFGPPQGPAKDFGGPV